MHRPVGLAPLNLYAYPCWMARSECPLCGGSGWKIVEGQKVTSPEKAGIPPEALRSAEAAGEPAFVYEGHRGGGGGLPRVAVRCECGEADRTTRLFDRARIPQRYRHCDFDNFEADLPYEHGAAGELASWNRSLQQAKLLVQSLARDFPVGVDHGLLLMGPCGVGKTHLAVAALHEIARRGHHCLFYDYRELLKEIQDSYNTESQATEMGVLEPVLGADVLLLDDLGASKPSLWALETLGHILNSRYNANRVTLLTTNFHDGTSGMQEGRSSRVSASAEDTLADRIGARIRSRLFEMCRTIEMLAPDYRREIRHAGHYSA